jgi:protein-disulfide isomerase
MHTTVRGLLAAPLTALALLAGACTDRAPIRDAGLVAGAQAAPAASPAAPASDERSPRQVVLQGSDLTGVGYDKGSATAPVVIVDFSDFGCPYCGKHAQETLPALEQEFIATGKVFYKYVPFVMGMFPNGDLAARAAECAADQGKFWPMHDRLYAAQRDWKRSRAPAPLFHGYATELGLDGARFAACHADARTEGRTQQANDRARRLGVRATPTFFVNGESVEGALPLDVFQRVLREMTAQ